VNEPPTKSAGVSTDHAADRGRDHHGSLRPRAAGWEAVGVAKSQVMASSGDLAHRGSSAAGAPRSRGSPARALPRIEYRAMRAITSAAPIPTRLEREHRAIER
jgi:hypothetical protein